MTQLYSDVRILDLSNGIPGPFCARIFADYGADVIKVEALTGDPSRRRGPFPGDIPNPEASASYLHLNRNKRGITLNLDTPSGVDLLKRLVKDVDIVIESFKPGYLASIGAGFHDLKEINSSIVLASITPFGQDGPYAQYEGTDLTYYAIGSMHMTGHADMYPIKKAASMVEHQVGNLATVAVAAAFLSARYQGQAQHVDVSAAESQQLSSDRRIQMLLGHNYNGETSMREPLSASALPMGIFPCADGHMQVMTTPAWADRMAKTLKRPDFMEKLAVPGALYSAELKAEIDEVLHPWLQAHTRAEIFAEALANQWPCFPINNVEDLLEDDHFRGRDFWVEQDHPVAGPLTYPGPLARVEDGFALRYPAPQLGEHNREFYSDELGLTGDELRHLAGSGVI
ncbi:MAG: CoA transferase [Pseudomonadales bacterium]|nr:CoA transferase [Pseudomonadales bacterium]